MAARLACAGVASVLSPRRATPRAIAHAARTIAGDSHVRAAVARAKEHLERAEGPAGAARLIEQRLTETLR
jgi:UDP:flavonoid glycosyltransferase YjiC (YdhE family)